MRNKEQVIERANNRVKAIEYASNRIKKKIADLPDDPRQEAWKKRLAEYDKSLEHLEIELRFGREFPVKGMPSENGVTVGVPTGQIKLEGK